MEFADLPCPFGLVADREDAEQLGPSRGRDGGDEFTKPLLDPGEVGHGQTRAGMTRVLAVDLDERKVEMRRFGAT